MGALLSEYADDLERNSADRDLLADHRRSVGLEHVGDAVTQHRHAPARVVVSVGEHAARLDIVVVDFRIISGGGQHVHIDVAIAVLHLLIPGQFGNHRLQGIAVPSQCVGVVRGEAHAILAGNAPPKTLAGIHREQIGSQSLNLFLDRPLGARSERNHRDDSPDADHDSEHRQERSQLVRHDRLKRDL